MDCVLPFFQVRFLASLPSRMEGLDIKSRGDVSVKNTAQEEFPYTNSLNILKVSFKVFKIRKDNEGG